MKLSSNTSLLCDNTASASFLLSQNVSLHIATTICSLLIIVFSSCTKENLSSLEKENSNKSKGGIKTSNKADILSGGNVVKDYPDLSKQTLWELQQARAATVKYQNIKHAIKDGYADINVDVEVMGHHFMKSSIVDGTFDIREPEILVYNRNTAGDMELVALEYAIPFAFGKPNGFSGSADVWDGSAGVPIWFLHAWVWRYNPAGVFNPTNPLVHLH